jgi:hypothetical protein
MNHRLFVATEIIGELIAILMEGLSESPHVSVTEDPETAGEERVGVSVSGDFLSDEETDEGLGRGQPEGVGPVLMELRHRCSLIPIRPDLRVWARP